MRVLRLGSITCAMTIFNVVALIGPAGLALLPVTAALLIWTLLEFRRLPRPRPLIARTGAAVAVLPFGGGAVLGAIFYLGPLSSLFLLAAVAFVGVLLAVQPAGQSRPGRPQALISAGLCIATDAVYLAMIASQGDPEVATVSTFSALMFGLATVTALGGVTGRRGLLWTSVLGLTALGIIGLFSIGFPLLVAAAFSGMAIGAIDRPVGRTPAVSD